jgi:hypothetical protein
MSDFFCRGNYAKVHAAPGAATEIVPGDDVAGAATAPGVSSLQTSPAGRPAGAFSWADLTPAEDGWLWAMRAEDVPFDQIQAVIEQHRRRRAGLLTHWARIQRDIIRRERQA